MTFLLDTDVYTLSYQSKFGLRDRFAKLVTPDIVVISIITRAEVIRGRMETVRKAADGAEWFKAYKWLTDSESYLASFPCLGVTPAAAATFDRLRVDKRVAKMLRGDLLMACVALGHGATLITRNVKDFAAVPGLFTASWTP